MDEVIYEEFKGTGNMELHLDRKVAESASTRRSISAAPVPAARNCSPLRTSCSVCGFCASCCTAWKTSPLSSFVRQAKDTKTNDEFFMSMKRK